MAWDYIAFLIVAGILGGITVCLRLWFIGFMLRLGSNAANRRDRGRNTRRRNNRYYGD